MAITLDTIVNKVFKVVKNGYDNNEVEAFLDEILEEMENREAQTNQLKEQVAALTRELEEAPEAEFDELVGLYTAKGLSEETARRVAEELTRSSSTSKGRSRSTSMPNSRPWRT